MSTDSRPAATDPQGGPQGRPPESSASDVEAGTHRQKPAEPAATSVIEVPSPRAPGDPAGERDTENGSTHTVEVVEPPIADRVRRPVDLFRLVLALVLLVAGISFALFATGTSGAVQQEIATAASGLPRLLLTLLSLVGGLGVVVLPVAVGTDLVLRRRPLQLVLAVGAALAGAVLTLVLDWLILRGPLDVLQGALTKGSETFTTDPFDIVLVALMALFTVADVTGRKYIAPAATALVVALSVSVFLAGSVTLGAVVSSILLGWAVGLAIRYAFGATSTRPPGTEVAKALVATGIPVTRLELVDPNDAGDRRYLATTDTLPVDVHVIDRDTFGIASGRRLLRVLRLRNGFTRAPSVTLRSELEHRTLMGLVLAQARIPAPRPVSVCEVGAFSALVAYVDPQGRSVAEIGDGLTDADLTEIWRMAGALQQRRVVHRSLGPNVVMITDDHRAGLRWVGAGDLAAEDVALRIDLAQLLTTVALAVGPERAVGSAVAELGPDVVVRTAPLLQTIALTRPTREALKKDKELLGRLRDQVVALQPSEEKVEPIQLRRVQFRTIVTVVGLAVAAYVVAPQLAQVDFGKVVSEADWRWAAACVAFAITTFAGACVALNGAVHIRLHFLRTYMVQLAVAFSGLVAPAAVGNIALNTRYLQTQGLPAAVAGAGVGLAQVAQFFSYVTLLVISSVIAGTGPRASFTPSPLLVAAIPVVVLLILGLLAVPKIRAFVVSRVVPPIKAALPQVLAVFQTPRKLVQLIGGALMLDASFVAALFCATRAFGADSPLASTAVVYFAGAIIGSAVPTPGGLGGIEAAMSAGLIAIGVDSGTAISSVLLYRLATYWLPLPFGWLSLNRLQKAHII